MLTIPWEEARQTWRGHRIIVQAEGLSPRAWQGTIVASYYEPVTSETPKPDPYALRIVYRDVRFTDDFPNQKKPFKEWTPCEKGPRLILQTRYFDFHVADNDHAGNKGGDLWCVFEIPEEYQRPSGPKCRRGWFVVILGKSGEHVLELAKEREALKHRRF